MFWATATGFTPYDLCPRGSRSNKKHDPNPGGVASL